MGGGSPLACCLLARPVAMVAHGRNSCGATGIGPRATHAWYACVAFQHETHNCTERSSSEALAKRAYVCDMMTWRGPAAVLLRINGSASCPCAVGLAVVFVAEVASKLCT